MVNGAKVEFSVVYSYCIDCESELMDPQDMAHNSNECAIIGTFIDNQFVKLGAK
jgi:exosome complex RNA-binding protein Csl4